MNLTEIRLIAYGVALLALLSFAGWSGHKLTAMHYDSIIAKDQLLQEKELSDAKQRIIDAQTAQKTDEDSARSDHDKLVKANELLSNSIHDSVHDIGDSLSRALSAAMANSAGLPGTSAVTGGDPELTAVLSEVGRAIEATSKSCLHDSAELTGILDQYFKLRKGVAAK